MWRKALKKGKCPTAGCDLRTKTCEHLDSQLEYMPGALDRPKLFYTNDVERLHAVAPEAVLDPTIGAWSLYRKLKGYGLANDQIQILLRKFLLDMPVRQIKEEMGWTSTETYYRRYRDALATLKTRGYKSGKR